MFSQNRQLFSCIIIIIGVECGNMSKDRPLHRPSSDITVSTFEGTASDVVEGTVCSEVLNTDSKWSAVGGTKEEEEYCTCESAKIKELYLEFYGSPGDHAGGSINVGQWGKLPNFKGPNIWVPPWLDFRTPEKRESLQPCSNSTSCYPEQKKEKPERPAVRIECDEPEQSVASIDLCICGDTCYSHKSSLPDQEGGPELCDLTSLSDVLEADSEPRDVKKSKKTESIQFRDIVHNTPLTPIVVFSRLEIRAKADITPSFINLMSFIQVAIKAVRVKIERFKHRAKFAAVNFSGSRRNVETNLNDVVFSVLAYSGCCYQIYLKGEDDVRLVPLDNQGPYIVCFTSLSGAIESLDCGLDVGCIFSIYK